jgi:hypothetical protein
MFVVVCSGVKVLSKLLREFRVFLFIFEVMERFKVYATLLFTAAFTYEIRSDFIEILWDLWIKFFVISVEIFMIVILLFSMNITKRPENRAFKLPKSLSKPKLF